jgi:hypothetical protein
MQLVEPKVSTDSKFFTNTFFLDNFTAEMDKEIVIVANNPSGTLATMIPIAKIKF